jgi:hypothetical protein
MTLVERLRARAVAPITDAEASTYHSLTDGEQAELRHALIREMSWQDWKHRPAWWWQATCRNVQVVKRACALRRCFANGRRP